MEGPPPPSQRDWLRGFSWTPLGRWDQPWGGTPPTKAAQVAHECMFWACAFLGHALSSCPYTVITGEGEKRETAHKITFYFIFYL